MQKQQFHATINAARNFVWHALWQDAHYRNWTSAFSSGSYAESEWKEGAEIKFLDGKGQGMYGIIEKMEEPSVMVFKHLGEIAGNEKKEPGTWAGATESYTLTEQDGKTLLTVEMDVEENWLDYFLKTWPLALEKLKAIAESDAIKKITVQTTVNVAVEKVWEAWSTPQDIMQWNNASPDWHTPKASNDLREGGSFSATMAAKDGSMSFDFAGVYDTVKTHEQIAYTLADGRKVNILFEQKNGGTHITETFEAESIHPLTMQQAGWQAILDNFKKYSQEKNR